MTPFFQFFPSLGHKFVPNENVPLQIAPLTSSKTQIPLSYYTNPVCHPSKGQIESHYSGGIGGMILGDVQQTSPYNLTFGVDESCTPLCQKYVDGKHLDRLSQNITNQYVYSLFVDDLLNSVTIDPIHFLRYYKGLQNWNVDLIIEQVKVINDQNDDSEGGAVPVSPSVKVLGGIPIGVSLEDEDTFVLFNHLHFDVGFNPETNEIVSFSVTPLSFSELGCSGSDLTLNKGLMEAYKAFGGTEIEPYPKILGHYDPQNPPKGENLTKSVQSVPYSYSVKYSPNTSISYATRYDAYVSAIGGPAEIHWSYIINGVNIVLLFVLSISTILLRILRKDLSMYNANDIESLRRETGWKLLHGDVFRKPRFSKMLASYLGIGSQLGLMSLGVIVAGVFGFVNMEHRGNVFTAAIVSFCLLGVVAGFVSARFNRFLQPDYSSVLFVTLATTFLYITLVLALHLLSSLAVRAVSQSSFGGDFYIKISIFWTPTIAVLALFFVLATPSTLLGTVMGYRRRDWVMPVQTNQIPRNLPVLPWYIRSQVLCPLAGIIPFGVLFGETVYIFDSVWLHKEYYLGGTLVVVLLLTFLLCAVLSIVCTYLLISHGSYTWWWRSWWVSAFSAVWMLLGAIWYYFAVLDLDGEGTLVYFTHTLTACYTWWCISGSIGVLSSFYFLKYIYGSIRVC